MVFRIAENTYGSSNHGLDQKQHREEMRRRQQEQKLDGTFTTSCRLMLSIANTYMRHFLFSVVNASSGITYTKFHIVITLVMIMTHLINTAWRRTNSIQLLITSLPRPTTKVNNLIMLRSKSRPQPDQRTVYVFASAIQSTSNFELFRPH